MSVVWKHFVLKFRGDDWKGFIAYAKREKARASRWEEEENDEWVVVIATS